MLLLLVMVLVVLFALSLANHFKVKSVTHGAPVVDSNPFDPSGRKRFRLCGDPVAFFGFSCTVFANFLAESPRLLVMAPRVLAKQPFFTEDIYELIKRFAGVDFKFLFNTSRFGLGGLAGTSHASSYILVLSPFALRWQPRLGSHLPAL